MLIHGDNKYKQVKKTFDYTVWRCVAYETHRCRAGLKTLNRKDVTFVLNDVHAHGDVHRHVSECVFKRRMIILNDPSIYN